MRAADDLLRLPAPDTVGHVTLEATLAARRSAREFARTPLALAEVGQLLWAGSGITGPDARLRANPSAGALHPLEVYAVLPDGVSHYEPTGHRLAPHRAGDVRAALVEAAYGQHFIAEAGACLVVAAVYARTTGKYRERGRVRYVPMDAAHAVQNVLLQAVALGLGAVAVGAFDDAAVQAVLALPADQTPLYLVPVGHRR